MRMTLVGALALILAVTGIVLAPVAVNGSYNGVVTKEWTVSDDVWANTLILNLPYSDTTMNDTGVVVHVAASDLSRVLVVFTLGTNGTVTQYRVRLMVAANGNTTQTIGTYNSTSGTYDEGTTNYYASLWTGSLNVIMGHDGGLGLSVQLEDAGQEADITSVATASNAYSTYSAQLKSITLESVASTSPEPEPAEYEITISGSYSTSSWNAHLTWLAVPSLITAILLLRLMRKF